MAYRWFSRFLLFFLSVCSLASSQEEKEEEQYRFRFRFPRVSLVRSGEHHAKDAQDHGHGSMSEEEFGRRVKEVAAFWEARKAKGGEITKQDVVELYHQAQDFKVVHAILNTVISGPESQAIGRLRQEIHEEVLETMAKSKEFGQRMGVNDFGSGADPAKVNAKTDIDFTSYSGIEGITGAAMVARYRELFRQVTKKYGRALDPGQMDIVAHQFEATIPDWRQNVALSDFEARVSKGLDLLRKNPEAYFLEGAFLQQVMRRSVDPNKTTFAWYNVGPGNEIQKTYHNAAQVPQYFYAPEIRDRYAWGAAVGNWHFFHAHGSDLAAQAKYILRSIDDGAGMLAGRVKFDEMEKLNREQRNRVIDELYGRQLSAADLEGFKALIETAVKIRSLKATDQLKVSTTAGQLEAYAPLVELEKRRAGGIELDNETLLKLATDRFKTSSNRLLLQNNILTSRSRLTDWLAPDLKLDNDLDVLDKDGRWTKIRIDRDTIKRLQFSAYFELKASLSLMDDAQISRIQDMNPRFHNDIEIIRKVIKTQKAMRSAPPDLSGEAALDFRQRLANEAVADYEHLKQKFREHGYAKGALETGKVLWARSEQLDDWFKRGVIDKLAQSEGGTKYIPWLHQMRQNVDKTNEHLLGAKWMTRLDAGNSIIEILKAYIREGEVNQAVITVALWEGISFFPYMDTLFSVQSGVEGVSTLVLVQIVPGYGQLLLTGNFVKGLIEIGGLMIFEPLKRDKVLLAYQGYLDPESSWWPFATGQKEKVFSPRPHLLLPVDREMKLPLEERREKMYLFFRDRVIPHIKHDFALSADQELPPELAQKEFEYLERHVKEYVDHWWNGTGPIFGEYDVLTVHRAQDLRPDLAKMLIKDYLTGKNRYLQKKMDEREKKIQTLLETYEQVASQEIAIEEEGKTLQGEGGPYDEAGQIFLGHVLDALPAIKPSIEIIAAPYFNEGESAEAKSSIEQINFRAKVTASMKEHPGPWKIEWLVEKPAAKGVDASGSTMDFASPSTVKSASEPGNITIWAIASDSAGKEIIRDSIQVEVERVPLEKGDKDKEDAGPKDGHTDEGSDLIERMDDLVEQAAAESQIAQKQCLEGEEKAEEAKQKAEALDKELQGLSVSSGAIKDKAQQLLRDLKLADALKKEIDQAAETIATSRDMVRKNAVLTCEAAVSLRKATTEKERKAFLEQARASSHSAQEAGIQAEEAYAKALAAFEKLQALRDRQMALMAEIDSFDSAGMGAANGFTAALQKRSASSAKLTEAQIFIDRLDITQAAGGEILEEGERMSIPSLTDKLNELYGQIVASRKNAADCPPQLQDTVDTLSKEAERLEAKLDQSVREVAAARELLAQAGGKESLDSHIDEAGAAMAVLEIFMANIEEWRNDALACKDKTEQEILKPITVPVPNLKRLPLGEARQLLSTTGLGIEIVAGGKAPLEELSYTVDTQTPAPGEFAAPGSKVKVVVFGAYATKVLVPDLMGKTLPEAREALGKHLKLAPVAGDEAPSPEQAHTVQSQKPAPHQEVEKESVVTVRIYQDYLRKLVVPDVTGLYLKDAEALLSGSGFAVVKVTGKAAPDTENENVVYNQTPASGEEVDAGEAVVTVIYYTSSETEPEQPLPAATLTPAGGFYVALSLYFPVLPGEVPEGEDAKGFYLTKLRNLRPVESAFKQFPQQKIFIHFYNEAVGTYRPEQFAKGTRHAVPFSLIIEGKGQIKGAFLMEAEAVFETFEQLAASYPPASYTGIKDAQENKPSLLFINVDNSDGMYTVPFAEKGAAGKLEGGPIFQGWPTRQMQENIDFTIWFVENFDCFIATAVYHTRNDPRLDTLRNFRDTILAASDAGRRLIGAYYRNGPLWALQLQERPIISQAIALGLDAFVWLLDRIEMEHPAVNNIFQAAVRLLDWALIPKEENDENP